MGDLTGQLRWVSTKADRGKHVHCLLTVHQYVTPAPGTSPPDLSLHPVAPNLPADAPFAATQEGKPRPCPCRTMCAASPHRGALLPHPRDLEQGREKRGTSPSPHPSTIYLQNLSEPSFLCAGHGPVSWRWPSLPRETRLSARVLLYSPGEVPVGKTRLRGGPAPAPRGPGIVRVFVCTSRACDLCHSTPREVFLFVCLFSYFLFN